MPVRLRTALLVCVGLVAASAQPTEPATAKEQGIEQPLDKYQAAREGAEDAVQRVQELRDSIASYASKSAAKDRVQGVESRVEGQFQARRHVLDAEFAAYHRRAESAVQLVEAGAWNSTDALAEAEKALAGMERTDDRLNELDKETKQEVGAGVHDLSDTARHQARAAEKEADHLARQARKKTDHLDNMAREFERPDAADRLDRLAEDAARKVQDSAELAARHIEDASQKAHKDVERAHKEAAKERQEAIKAVRKLVKKGARQDSGSAEAGPAGAATAVLADADRTSPAGLVALWAVSVGAAVSIIAMFSRRRSDDGELDKYLLVV